MSKYQTYLESSLARLRTVLDDSGSRPILFIGSGMSIRYLNTPDWIGLLEKLIDLNPQKRFPIGYYTQNTNNDYPAVASALIEEYQDFAWDKHEEGIFPENLYGHTFHKSIFLKYQISEVLTDYINHFNVENNPYAEELESFITLNPHAVITTNYDTLIEKLLTNYKVVIGQQVIKRKEATEIGHILKVHGCMTNPSEIIVSSEDYKIFKEKQKYLIAKLLTYFLEHPVIFLGYSINDSNIKNILSDVAEIINEDGDEVVNNIWFIDYKEDIKSDDNPPMDKTIDLGESKSIRVNYLQLNNFKPLYDSLYQHNSMTMDTLRELQSNIYNIIKSRTITNLEVDMISIESIKDEEELSKLLGVTTSSDTEYLTGRDDGVKVIGVGNVSSTEQLVAMYPMKISQVAKKLGFSYWYPVDKMIQQVHVETGFNIKGSNNLYHIDIGITQPEHRYSKKALQLFEQIINNDRYEVINEDEVVISP
ncbi:SIR2 family protein [Halobacillus sp. Cin3]|uniref:SIR2 family protein n=1 Tax=Halobacillus sp. Cin3 TaxID=2928441 RepID=UPI00248D57AD|nr:SIR2 family protein [Halobacillus sp. Cin3]